VTFDIPLYNMVIIPRIEFRSQLTFFIKSQCDSIQNPFHTLFKYKLRMSKNIPNAILTNNLIYKFEDLYFRQI